MSATSMMGTAKPLEFQEAIEFSRVSIVQQHELLAVILCSAIEKGQAEVQDFRDFIHTLRKTDRYDHLLVHLFPIIGAYITRFGSTEGMNDLSQARELHQTICKQTDDDVWALIYLRATFRAWWIAEYSGFYMDDFEGIPGVDLDVEDAERTKLFLESAKDGAFDFLLSIAADCKATDWQDPVRSGIRQWLQRKSPALASDPVPFSDFFQHALMLRFEVFIDAFISNLPDVLRKLRTEEDEQRQLSHTHEQDLDLERFLIIIAYSYEGRPGAAMSFWEDPDSNLAGFLSWASKRASTPLVSAFCEMLQSLSDNEQCATAAHNFLLDEGHHASGKMRRSQSLTWSQIFKELWYFIKKIQEKHSPAQLTYRGGKPAAEQAETEPESAMMLECYMRLMAKLAVESETARLKLLTDQDFHLVAGLLELTSSMIPPRLRACAFYVLKALLTRATQEESYLMWKCVDSWVTGAYAVQPNRTAAVAQQQEKAAIMETTLKGLGEGFEEANAFVQFLASLVTPAGDESSTGLREPLYDSLPFPDDLGTTVRMGGVEPYVDFVFRVFAVKSRDIHDLSQLRVLRLSCLEFALTCLATFNEDLIIFGSESSIAIDTAISAKDLSTYIRFHPFARVMEWMFNDKVIDALFQTIHQDATEVGNAAPETPLIQGILRGVEVMLKVLELQATYLNLVRPAITLHPEQRQQPVANTAYASFEDGIMNHLNLVVDLGRYCGIGHPDLTMACLKLLEKISTSSKIISAWNPDTGRHGHRNKAIVALEKNGEAEAISISLISELTATLDFNREADAPNYVIKNHILDFIYECLKAAPDQPTIAHLLLGFSCGINALKVEPGGAFDTQASLFHSLLAIFLEVPALEEGRGVRGWLLNLRYKVLRVFQLLLNSPLSSNMVIEELRSTKFLFHLLLREVQIQPHLAWDGVDAAGPDFLVTTSSRTYVTFLSMRALSFEYIGRELCSVSQQRIPVVKRQIFDALGGHVQGDDNSTMNIPNVFDLYDFLAVDGLWDISNLQFNYFKDLDLTACAEQDPDLGFQYNIRKVREVLALKLNESRVKGTVVPQAELAVVEREEALVIEYILFSNRQKQLSLLRLRVLKAWTSLVLVMLESNDFKGATKTSFLLQALQAILPSLERFSADSPSEAFELARLAKVLLFKLDLSPEPASAVDIGSGNIGNLVSDKLFQLFQICLNGVGKWTDSAELRTIYYSICYRYVTTIFDDGHAALASGRNKAIKVVALYGERLLHVICDDAYGGDTACQTAAVILLSSLVHLDGVDDSDNAHVIDTLNRLNFIGVLVDSLKGILAEWLLILAEGGSEPAEQLTKAKLALLLQLCQAKQGAKFVLQANLFRSLELSGVFAADPELEIDGNNTRALEKHYSLLVRLARIISAAVLARGSHNVLQGRRFLTQHRMLVMHTLKRSVGIGTVGSAHNSNRNGARSGVGGGARGGDPKSQAALQERIEELAEAFMLLITATGFLEFEDDHTPTEKPRPTSILFH
ncbi:hypothetical protein GQ53DRAFT_748373 [Thozetella sp. PMI_491]|nr:hypothetical protein GQ53DRAFT_748373 [Thozetella sp. PMI_491]